MKKVLLGIAVGLVCTLTGYLVISYKYGDTRPLKRKYVKLK